MKNTFTILTIFLYTFILRRNIPFVIYGIILSYTIVIEPSHPVEKFKINSICIQPLTQSLKYFPFLEFNYISYH